MLAGGFKVLSSVTTKMNSWLALLLAMSSFAYGAEPVLSGLYSAGELGLIEFTSDERAVVGKLKAGGQCSWQAGTPVVQGAFENDVFVGQVMLCQEGPPQCQPMQYYPLLAVNHRGALSGFIHLQAGCQSPALDLGGLLIRPATIEERESVDGALDGAVARGDSWETFVDLALAQIKQGKPERALPLLESAVERAAAQRVSGAQLSQILIHRARAQVQLEDETAAMSSLRTAVRMGVTAELLKTLMEDSSLASLRRRPDWKRFLAEATQQRSPKR